ncbi:MAG: hypothetical protein ABI606_08740 [Rhodoferax sp.]
MTIKTAAERQREITRSVALLYLLRERVGTTSINGFSEKYDALASPENRTQGQGKNGWQAIFNGLRPLSESRLKSLSAVPVWSDSSRLYQHGPANLWRAMWGPVDELRLVVADELTEWKSFDQMLAEFEGDLLLAEIDRAPLTLACLAKAVALYRLHRDVLGLDGVGACRCVRLCLGNDQVQTEMDGLGVLKMVNAELKASILSESNLESAQASADSRWDAIAPRLAWVT